MKLHAADSPTLETALDYGERGWSALPVFEIGPDGSCTCAEPGGPRCTPGKHPATQNGVSDATADPARHPP